MSEIAQILLQLALIIVVARLAGLLAGRVGIPPVVGEICAGILLGPTLLGDVSAELFPVDQRDVLDVLAKLGLVLFMFVVGLELDLSVVRGRGRAAGSISGFSIALPFVSGIALAVALQDLRHPDASFWPFALFVGAAMSITAFPVLARILTDRQMHRTETGGLALASAAVDDVLAWTLLAGVIGLAGATMPHGDSDHAPPWFVLFALPFVLLAIFVVRPQLTRLTGMYQRAGELTPSILSIVLVGLLLFSAATEVIGIHFIFGAFIFGAILPHENAAALRHEILVRLEQLAVLLLLPVFFLIAGLSVNLRDLALGNLAQLAAILAVAITGKYIGAYLGARSAGVPHWQANALGILMNTRGLTEIVILTVGVELHLIGDDLFSMMVVMALVTTVMTGPLINVAYPARRVARDIAEAERAALGDEAVDRILLVARRGEQDSAALDLAVAMLAGSRPAEVVVADLEPQGRRLEMGSGLSGELAEVAAAMERQEILVRRGAEAGVPVRVIAHPSGDVAAELTELVQALAPQGVVLWSGDPSGEAVLAVADCPAAVLASGSDWSATTVGPREEGVAGGAIAPRAVELSWAAGPDGEAAILLGARIAVLQGVPLVWREGGPRRAEVIRAALLERGVEVLPALSTTGSCQSDVLEIDPVQVGALGAGTGEAAIAVRAAPQSAPLDFATVVLSESAPHAAD